MSQRVFLTGKEHVEYRRGLNLLFTRKALGYVCVAVFPLLSLTWDF